MQNELTFLELRLANLERLPQFRNLKGELSHTLPNGEDWSYNDWVVALAGEVGEIANFAKKHRRGDISTPEFIAEAAKEIADVQIYLDLLCIRLGLDLGEMTRQKFNEVSERVGSDVRL